MEALVTSYNTFAVSVYKKLIEHNDKKNIFFSPMSIASALTVLFPGTKGNTEFQMANVLNFRKASGNLRCHSLASDAVQILNIPQVFEEFSSSMNQTSNSYTMKMANRLFSEESLKISQKYSKLIEKSFQANIQPVDFLKAAEMSRKSINTWVEEQTDGRIKDILPPDSIDSLTKLVLVNAIYFKGSWKKKFPEENTEQKSFRLSKTKTKPVPMMFQKNKFNISYIENLKTKVLELPYIDDEISMIIMLPEDIVDNSTGLEQLEKELSYEKLKDWSNPAMMDKSEVEINLPRILLAENYDMKSYLTEMGLGDLFKADKADLTGISDKGNLYVKEIFHKAFVEIKEEGTEAAAATAAIITARMRPIVEKFIADHPFIFIIMHNQTKTILFMGKYSSP